MGEVAPVFHLGWAPRIFGDGVGANNLAKTGLAVHYIAYAARLWVRDDLAHVVCQAGVLRPGIAPPVMGRVLNQAGTGPEMALNYHRRRAGANSNMKKNWLTRFQVSQSNK